MAENEALQAQQGAVETIEVSELDKLLVGSFKPKSTSAETAVQNGVQALVGQALENTALVSEDSVKTIEAMISALDRKLTEQVNQILHHEDFQQLEGTWRGLSYLVNNTETDETLKIRVFNTSKKDLAKELKRYRGTKWDQSPLFKKIYEEEYGQAGGEPIACLIGDYFFDHSAKDVGLMQDMAKIGAAAHAPFIAGANPSLMDMESWQEVNDPADLTAKFQGPAYAPWRSFRESADSKYLGLAMPRFLSRLPYSSKDNPVEDFVFEEETGGDDHLKFAWSNSAYAMATNITRSFKQYGWCARIRGHESGGMVSGLPCHTFATDDGGVDMKCPTEVAIPDRREAELAKNGLMPLIHYKNTSDAVFISAESVHQAAEYEDPDATANAKLGARLPYLFATCRFAHYLKCIVRDKIGSYADLEGVKSFLENWISQYVTDSGASDEVKAKYPLAEAEVSVHEDPENPGQYNAKFSLRPHYQLEGLTVSLSLVSKLPSKKGGE